jgi:hypothetical protein
MYVLFGDRYFAGFSKHLIDHNMPMVCLSTEYDDILSSLHILDDFLQKADKDTNWKIVVELSTIFPKKLKGRYDEWDTYFKDNTVEEALIQRLNEILIKINEVGIRSNMWRPIHVVATGIELVGLPWINNFSNLIVHQSLRELSGEPNIQPCALSEENYLAIGEYLLTRHMSNVFEYHQYTSKTYVPKEEDLKRINGDRDLEAAVIEYQNRHSCLSGLIDSYG